MQEDLNKIEWNERWEEGHIKANSFLEYKSQMGVIVNDLLDELKLTIDNLKIEDKSILDIGGGYGAILNFLFPKSNDKYLVDLSETGIKLARELFHFRNAFIVDILHEDLPFEKKFDVILLNEVIEHIHPSEVHLLISKVYDLLKPDGLLILSTPNLASFSSKILLIFGKIPLTFILDKTHISVFTPSSLNSLIKSKKFRNVILKTTCIRIFPFKVKLPFRINNGEHIIGVWKKMI